MKIKPVMTEKSLEMAKNGQYTFFVPVGTRKTKIKEIIKDFFDVDAVQVKTMKYKGGTKTNIYKKRIEIKPRKKAIVVLREGQKIDIFSTEKKK